MASRTTATSSPNSWGSAYPTVSGTLTVVAPASTAARDTSTTNRGSVRVASCAGNSTSSVWDLARRTLSRTASSTWRSLIRSISRRWISLVETKTWMRKRSAGPSASAHRSTSASDTRASPAITDPFTCPAMSLTASNSPWEDTGNPASITSTPSRASWSAISTFSARVSAIPGACSPSRSVVSKNLTTSSGIGRTVPAAKPRHHRAKPLADLLDQLLPPGRAKGLELGIARARLEDPLLGELAGADLAEDPAHLLARSLVHDTRTSGVVAVLRGVRHGVPHASESALVQEVDDQLQLVEAFEVRHLGLVARLHQRLE